MFHKKVSILFLVLFFIKPIISNASDLINVTRSFLDLIDRIHFQKSERNITLPLSTREDFSDKYKNLRFFYSFLLAREQPNPTSSYDIYLKKVVRPSLRHFGFENGDIHLQSMLGNCLQPIGHSNYMYSCVPGKLSFYSVPDKKAFEDIDKFSKDEIVRKTKSILIYMLDILTKDSNFKEVCRRCGLLLELNTLESFLKAVTDTFEK